MHTCVRKYNMRNVFAHAMHLKHWFPTTVTIFWWTTTSYDFWLKTPNFKCVMKTNKYVRTHHTQKTSSNNVMHIISSCTVQTCSKRICLHKYIISHNSHCHSSVAKLTSWNKIAVICLKMILKHQRTQCIDWVVFW